ncbi:uncharacterized protein LOC108097245 [Drosophila ficusphila]|uniref:uncharacterized protein LOC108097245 n=1 Tax=Drosophila ficusphila TaxID=30025 RepID=UPI0007E7FEEA|nr:uncharacterized protein LOC108097245 [Drosophila ficusphila]
MERYKSSKFGSEASLATLLSEEIENSDTPSSSNSNSTLTEFSTQSSALELKEKPEARTKSRTRKKCDGKKCKDGKVAEEKQNLKSEKNQKFEDRKTEKKRNTQTKKPDIWKPKFKRPIYFKRVFLKPGKRESKRIRKARKANKKPKIEFPGQKPNEQPKRSQWWYDETTKQEMAELRWKMFTDEEYADWKTFRKRNFKVPLRSVFSYLDVKPCPVTISTNQTKMPVLRVLSTMIEGNYGAFAHIQIGDKTFRCIPNLLKCYSVWFANRDWRINHFRFPEREVPARGFEVLYRWMRTEQLPDFNTSVSTLQVSRHLQVHMLEKVCWEILSDSSVREKVAFQVYLEAKRLPALQLVCEVMLNRLRYSFLALVGSSEFLDLPVEVMELILRRDSIGVNSEMEVFFAALRWLGHKNVSKRLKYLRRLMACVRFHHLPMTFLFSLRESITRPDKEELFRPDPVLKAFHADPETMTKLEHAMSFIGVRCQYDDTEEFLSVCEAHGISVVFPRHWVYHAKCPYHKKNLTFPYQHRFTATDFDNYIDSIQKIWAGKGPADHGQSLITEIDYDPLLRKKMEWGPKN